MFFIIVVFPRQKSFAVFLGGVIEARLRGFRGGEGTLEMVQRRGTNPLLLVVLDGMQSGKVS